MESGVGSGSGWDWYDGVDPRGVPSPALPSTPYRPSPSLTAVSVTSPDSDQRSLSPVPAFPSLSPEGASVVSHAAGPSPSASSRASDLGPFSRPRPSDFSKFNPANGESFDAFMEKLDAEMLPFGFSEAERLRVAVSSVTGDAALAALSLRNRDPSPSAIVAGLRLLYPDDPLTLVANFKGLVQGSRSVAEYVTLKKAAHERLTMRAAWFTPSTFDSVHAFTSGLNVEVFERFSLKYSLGRESTVESVHRDLLAFGVTSNQLSAFRPSGASSAPGIAAIVPAPASASGSKNARRGDRDRSSDICHRCQESGHHAKDCTAPKPIPKSQGKGKGQ